MTAPRRWAKATEATVLGWAVAFILASLVQTVVVLRGSGPDLQLVLAALGYSFAAWLLLTVTGVLLVWFCIVSPIALFFSASWLLRRRVWIMSLSMAAGLLVVGGMAHLWRYLNHGGTGLLNFWTGASFVLVFTGVTAYYYLRFLGREESK